MGRLTSGQVAAFFDEGFVVLPEVFRAAEVAQLRAAFERLEARALRSPEVSGTAEVVLAPGAAASVARVVWCGGLEPELERWGRDPRLVAPAAQLLGVSEVEQLINQAHFKRPHDGVAYPWHQDSAHRRYGTDAWTDVNGRGSYVQTVTAVDAVRADNGPLRLIPGSGRRGHLGVGPEGTLPADGFDPRRAVAPELAPGSVLLFGPFTVHGSEPNRSGSPRRVLINGYACPGANRRVYPGAGTGRSLRPCDGGWTD